MKRILWDIKRTGRNLGRRIVKWFRSFFFDVTVENIKKTSYPDLPAPIAWDKIAKGRNVNIEVGSGHGEVLLANNALESIIIGYEIKSRFFRLSQRKTKRREDIFIFKGSGYESLFLHYPNGYVNRIYILFPDPWHKKKHSKRRPLTAQFFNAAAQKLKVGGEIVIATDWTEYAEFVKSEAAKVTKTYEVQTRPYSAMEFNLPVTHYHQKWERKGRKFTVIVLKKLG